jgi:single-stranded DNA-binding protein
MIDALISGKLIRQPELKIGQSGKTYTNLMISVSVGDSENIVVTAMAFGEVAERLSKLGKGDAVSLAGSLKPTEYIDKKTSETKHGLSITVNQSLSIYDIQKRRKKPEQAANSSAPFNDDIPW